MFGVCMIAETEGLVVAWQATNGKGGGRDDIHLGHIFVVDIGIGAYYGNRYNRDGCEWLGWFRGSLWRRLRELAISN